MTGTSTSADWSRLTADLLTELRSTSDGLSITESRERTDAAIVIASAVLSFA